MAAHHRRRRVAADDDQGRALRAVRRPSATRPSVEEEVRELSAAADEHDLFEARARIEELEVEVLHGLTTRSSTRSARSSAAAEGERALLVAERDAIRAELEAVTAGRDAAVESATPMPARSTTCARLAEANAWGRLGRGTARTS